MHPAFVQIPPAEPIKKIDLLSPDDRKHAFSSFQFIG